MIYPVCLPICTTSFVLQVFDQIAHIARLLALLKTDLLRAHSYTTSSSWEIGSLTFSYSCFVVGCWLTTPGVMWRHVPIVIAGHVVVDEVVVADGMS